MDCHYSEADLKVDIQPYEELPARSRLVRVAIRIQLGKGYVLCIGEISSRHKDASPKILILATFGQPASSNA